MRLAFLYKATECLANFVIDPEGIPFGVEVGIQPHGFEVELRGAVLSEGKRNVLAVVDARVALVGSRRLYLPKGVVMLFVFLQHALIVLAQHGDAVVKEDGFQVDAEVGVLVQVLLSCGARAVLFFEPCAVYSILFCHCASDRQIC